MLMRLSNNIFSMIYGIWEFRGSFNNSNAALLEIDKEYQAYTLVCGECTQSADDFICLCRYKLTTRNRLISRHLTTGGAG